MEITVNSVKHLKYKFVTRFSGSSLCKKKILAVLKRGSVVVKALSYKSEGRGIESR
jgi:hypothetical protein